MIRGSFCGSLSVSGHWLRCHSGRYLGIGADSDIAERVMGLFDAVEVASSVKISNEETSYCHSCQDRHDFRDDNISP
jgi:hypothetical protein